MKVVFLKGAEEDLKELRHYVIKNFGRQVWQETYSKVKESVQTIQTFPQGGSVPDELADFGMPQFRQVISGMNRIIYEVREETIFIHIVCDTRRDMRTLLSRRLLRIAN